jgi:hypothetical protein
MAFYPGQKMPYGWRENPWRNLDGTMRDRPQPQWGPAGTPPVQHTQKQPTATRSTTPATSSSSPTRSTTNTPSPTRGVPAAKKPTFKKTPTAKKPAPKKAPVAKKPAPKPAPKKPTGKKK